MSIVDQLLYRIQRLRIPVGELGIAPQLMHIQHSIERNAPDWSLIQCISDGITRLEQQLLVQPFLPPSVSLDSGNIEIGRTPEGAKVSINIGEGDGTVQHILIPGTVHSGKTSFAAALACQACEHIDVLLIDSQDAFARIRQIHERGFEFLDLRRDLRLQPDLMTNEAIQTFTRGFAQSYSVIYGRVEMEACIRELLERGNVFLPLLLGYMQQKVYRGNTNKARYRDSVVLNLSSCIDGLAPLFDCSRGMDLRSIITRGRVVLKVNCLVEHQAFLLRYLFDFCTLLKASGQRLKRPLLIIIDEAQLLLERCDDLADRLLTMRHANVFFAFNVQSPSTIPAKALNACSACIALNLVDYRDKLQISKAINLTREQFQVMGTQGPREAICFIPRLHSRPFLLRLPGVDVYESPIEVAKPHFVTELEWTPAPKTDTQKNANDDSDFEIIRRFILDVVNNEFDPALLRWQRLGIRNRATQARLVKKMVADELVRTHVAIDQHGKRTLFGLLPAARAYLDGELPKRKGKGSALARFYCHRLYEHYSRLSGHDVVIEGMFGGKCIDLCVQLSSGRLTLFEIAACTLDHEIQNLLAIVRAPNIDDVESIQLLTSTKEQAKKLARLVDAAAKNHEEVRLHMDLIHVSQFAEFASHLQDEHSS